MKIKVRDFRGELEELFGSREWEFKITFPFCLEGTGIKELHFGISGTAGKGNGNSIKSIGSI